MNNRFLRRAPLLAFAIVAVCAAAQGAAMDSATTMVMLRKVAPYDKLSALTDRCIGYTKSGERRLALLACRDAARIADERLAKAAPAKEADLALDAGLAHSNLAVANWFARRSQPAQEHIARALAAAPTLGAIGRNAATIRTAERR